MRSHWMTPTPALGLLVFALVTPSAVLDAQDWPHWRGPSASGVSPERGLPTRWSDTENIAWKVVIPGKGHSSPVI